MVAEIKKAGTYYFDTNDEVLTSFRWFWPYIMYIPGQKKPNELGVHDMSGQAFEWVIGPWTNFGELYPLHNPGRILLFDFAEPFYQLQKGGNPLWIVDGGHSYVPESRQRFQPDIRRPDFDREFARVSVRLARNSDLQQEQRELQT